MINACLFCLALAGASVPQPEVELSRVQVQGESAAARETKTLGQLFKAEALFAEHQALAPAATLKFKVYARKQADAAPSLALGLMTPATRGR